MDLETEPGRKNAPRVFQFRRMRPVPLTVFLTDFALILHYTCEAAPQTNERWYSSAVSSPIVLVLGLLGFKQKHPVGSSVQVSPLGANRFYPAMSKERGRGRGRLGRRRQRSKTDYKDDNTKTGFSCKPAGVNLTLYLRPSAFFSSSLHL
jgi:hypothetical protein